MHPTVQEIQWPMLAVLNLFPIWHLLLFCCNILFSILTFHRTNVSDITTGARKKQELRNKWSLDHDLHEDFIKNVVCTETNKQTLRIGINNDSICLETQLMTGPNYIYNVNFHKRQKVRTQFQKLLDIKQTWN